MTKEQPEAENIKLRMINDSLLEALKEIASNYDLVKSTKNQTAITLCAKAKAAIQKTEQT